MVNYYEFLNNAEKYITNNIVRGMTLHTESRAEPRPRTVRGGEDEGRCGLG